MKKFSILASLIFCICANLFAQDKSGKVIDKVVAVVGDNIVLKSEIEQQYANYILQGNKPNEDTKCLFLQSMLSQKLLTQQAVLDSITVTEEDIDGEVDRRMRSMVSRAGGQDRLEEFLGKSIIQYKDEIRPDIREVLVAQKMQAKITEKVEVTPLEVKRFFSAFPKDSLPEYNTEVEVGEVVVYPELNKKEKEFYKDKAEGLRLRVKQGESFSTLARLYSQDPGSAREGGELPFFDRQTMAKEFTSWAFKLKQGEMSPVFETEFGFHFLEILERRGEQVRVRHLLIIPENTPEALERARVRIDSTYQKVVSGKLDFSTAASLYSDEKETKFNGGMMLDNQNVSARTTHIPTDKLDPKIFLTIDTMKVGAFSKPELFADARGKTGYRFLYLRSKVPPHKANLAQDLPKIRDAAFEDKINKTVSEWFEKRRKSIYIKIDKEYQDCAILKDWITTPVTAEK